MIFSNIESIPRINAIIQVCCINGRTARCLPAPLEGVSSSLLLAQLVLLSAECQDSGI